MQLVFLILLIPLCSISVSVYINSLMNYAFYNTLNIPLFSTGLALSLILGFLSLHLFNNVRTLSANKLNFESKVIPYFSYYSFVMLVLFGISLIVNNFLNTMNIFAVMIGVVIVIIFAYITFAYMFNYKTGVFVLGSIDDVDDDLKADDKNKDNSKDDKKVDIIKSKVKCLTFENEEIDFMEFYVEDGEYLVEKHYSVIYNPKLKIIKKVLNEVNVIE